MLRFASMRVLIPLLAFLCMPFFGQSQKSGQRDWELGASAGTSWYNGDLNPDKHFGRDYMKRAFGVSLRKNLNKRFALRGTFKYGQLAANDRFGSTSFQQTRNLNFETDLYELATTFEFNFFEFDALISGKKFTPYTFIGLAGFYFNPTTEVEGNFYELQPLRTENVSYSRFSVSLPFGFGLKYAINDRLIVSSEWGLRKTWTDYIDDVSTIYPADDQISGLAEDLSDRSLEQQGPDGTNWNTQRGTERTEDWYSFVTGTIAFRIGPKKGSCKHLRN